jgi:Fe-S cluster assembly iron-binding protein IscA
MFEITEKATEMIKEAFRGHEKIPSIRVSYDQGG